MKKILIAMLSVTLLSLFTYEVVDHRHESASLEKKEESVIRDYKNGTYRIDGADITLHDGKAEIPIMKDSAAKRSVTYFGNDLIVDLNNDGRDDVVFLVTDTQGGSGTFFYVVSALRKEDGGYVGSDAYFLGDRIAPQAITKSQNTKHLGVVVVNYAERKEGEPMTVQPSVGKSVYLKLDPGTMQWGIVMPNFEGESR